MIEFQAWPKIARLNRDCIITEKIDGTNAAVGIVRIPEADKDAYQEARHGMVAKVVGPYNGGDHYAVYAQSRKKLIVPGQDNAGFARYVHEHASEFVRALGEGLHFGEWWGSGIQRGYGLLKGEKRFSLFNTPRYTKPEFDLTQVPGLSTVPVLWEGGFSTGRVDVEVQKLAAYGSQAAPGFMSPEGIIVFHVAAQVPFKVTILNDAKPKGSNE